MEGAEPLRIRVCTLFVHVVDIYRKPVSPASKRQPRQSFRVYIYILRYMRVPVARE